jgi:EmrB/QacA subfamily drug resistance transporter
VSETRGRWLTLAAMTLASSMILVDQTAVPLATPEAIEDLGGQISQAQWIMTANIIPLAALMVLGGRLGDLIGLRRVFLAGALVFGVSTALAGFAQDMPWMIAARATQGMGAALMMPTAVAIVAAVFPAKRRGTALGILAGASAFFAALGPVLGGLLTSVDWRLVLLINVPLAALTVVLTLSSTPKLGAASGASRSIDLPGVITFALGVAAIVFGLSEAQAEGWGSATVVISLIAGAAFIALFVVLEHFAENPMIEFRLFRHLNYLAANISQVLAGMVELGLGFLLPFYLLLVVGVSPEGAGLALIPSTIPIILAGPLAGRAFDKIGGRWPLVVGFLVLAASGVALAIGVSDESVTGILPGLVLQGFGLGIVLTVNDPTGLTAVPKNSRGQAAGMINTSEQLGGAIGIAILTAIEVGRYRELLFDKLAEKGVADPTEGEIDQFKEFILKAEEKGLIRAESEGESKVIRFGLEEVIQAHISAFELMFLVTAGIAVVGALVSLLLVRPGDPVKEKVFSRRSRWVYALTGGGAGLTKTPPPGNSRRRRPGRGSS